MDSVLIANRGEIARRIVRSCRSLGLRSIVIYSPQDARSIYLAEADEAIALEGNSLHETYLNIEQILSIARQLQTSAIHPGYGFLSESTVFAQAVQQAGLIFVGPRPAVLKQLGDKDTARKLAIELNIPTLPGLHVADNIPPTPEALQHIPFPLVIKAVGGGGGKGMRRVDRLEDFEGAWQSASREAKSAFGDDRLLIERYLPSARHVEVQLVGDSSGEVRHFFERECSLQRRYQKVIEESPAADLSDKLRSALYDSAVKLGTAAKLNNLATVEFLVAPAENPQEFFFLESNPRLQVEHPVTELVTGVDLVEIQLRVARGELIKNIVSDLSQSGHAIQARVYAENAYNHFLPSLGYVQQFQCPDSVRVETALTYGISVTAQYDPLLAKLISFETTRVAAADSLRQALETFQILGVATNLPLLIHVLKKIARDALIPNTSWLDNEISSFANCDPLSFEDVFFATYLELLTADLNSTKPFCRSIEISIPALNHSRNVDVTFVDSRKSENVRRLHFTLEGFDRQASVTKRDVCFEVALEGRAAVIPVLQLSALIKGRDAVILSCQGVVAEIGAARHCIGATQSASASQVVTPLPGILLAVHVAPGQRVTRGALLFTIESMKMEHSVVSPRDGVIDQILVASGVAVDSKTPVIQFQDSNARN